MAHPLGHLMASLVRCLSCRRRGASTLHALGVAAFVVLASVTAGQSTQPAQAVRFTVFSAQPIKDVAFAPRANAASQTLQFYPTARSPRYDYRGPMPLRFVDATSREVVAEATIPPEIRDALLLFTPLEAGATGLRYRIAVLDDSAARLPSGTLNIINLSGLTLQGSVGKDAATLKAGLNPPMPIGRSSKVVLRTAYQGRTYQSYADTVQIAPKQRALLILFPPFYKGSLEVQSRLLIDEPPGARP